MNSGKGGGQHRVSVDRFVAKCKQTVAVNDINHHNVNDVRTKVCLQRSGLLLVVLGVVGNRHIQSLV